ncbi:MAG: uracil-DNA glycosylase family protein [Bacteroidota bacterium]
MTFADHVINFNRKLWLPEEPIKGIKSLNPFVENQEVGNISRHFYKKFYDDCHQRHLILGINPGRLGAGATGIPFTDTKRLTEVCGIAIGSVQTHEPSSVFVYDLIEAYGGAECFYGRYYINSVCPLGFVTQSKKGNWVNCNYYDDEQLFETLYDFMVIGLKKQIAFGINTETCYVLGKKNAKYLKRINDREKLFETLVVFDHPRYIAQYKSKQIPEYLEHFLGQLT